MSQRFQISGTSSSLADVDEEALINLVKSYKILYDKSSPTNVNKIGKENAWKEVSECMNKEVLWCTTTWAKLREAYRKRKRNIIGKTGQARKKIEDWAHFTSMQFLDDFILEAKTSGNAEFAENGPALNTEDIEANDIVVLESDDLTPSTVGKSKNNAMTAPMSVKKVKRSTDQVDEELIKFLKKPDQLEDTNYHFAMSIAEQLRRLPQSAASLAKSKIFQILYEIEVGLQSQFPSE